MQQRFDRLDESFADLQRDVAVKPSQTITSTVAGVDVAPFDVADEIDGRGLQQLVRFARQLVPLALLLADRKQADARGSRDRARCARRRPPSARIGRDAADGTRRVAPESSSTAGAVTSGDDRSEGRTIDARQAAEGGDRGHHRGAGMAGAEETAAARPSRTASAATRIDARGLRRSAADAWLRHPDVFGRIEDLDVERPRAAGMPGQLAFDRAPGRRPAAARSADAARRRAPRR